MVLKIYQNANSPQGCGLYFAKYSPQPSSNIPHGEFLSTVNLNFVPQRNNSTANIRIQHMYVRSGLTSLLAGVIFENFGVFQINRPSWEPKLCTKERDKPTGGGRAPGVGKRRQILSNRLRRRLGHPMERICQ